MLRSGQLPAALSRRCPLKPLAFYLVVRLLAQRAVVFSVLPPGQVTAGSNDDAASSRSVPARARTFRWRVLAFDRDPPKSKQRVDGRPPFGDRPVDQRIQVCIRLDPVDPIDQAVSSSV